MTPADMGRAFSYLFAYRTCSTHPEGRRRRDGEAETVGRSRAMHLLLKGERLDAGRAEEIGLIDFVVDGSAMQAGVDYASSLQENAPLALGASKQAVLSALRLPRAESRPVTSALFERLWFSEDHREAERAFIEKRGPRFKGD